MLPPKRLFNKYLILAHCQFHNPQFTIRFTVKLCILIFKQSNRVCRCQGYALAS